MDAVEHPPNRIEPRFSIWGVLTDCPERIRAGRRMMARLDYHVGVHRFDYAVAFQIIDHVG